MANIRLSIVIRTDLNLPLGLLAAQVGHIAHIPFTEKMNDSGELKVKKDDLSKIVEWNRNPYIFIHKVPNAEALKYFEEKAKQHKLTVGSWNDTIFIEMSPTQKQAFPNVPVGFYIGPEDSDKIRVVLGDLPLL